MSSPSEDEPLFSSELHDRIAQIARYEWVHDDNFIARAYDGLDSAEQSLGRATADSDFRINVDGTVLQAARLVRDNLPESRHARHRRVLVAAVRQMMVHTFRQRSRRLETRKSLCEIDRTGRVREVCHNGKYRRADVWQFAVDRELHLH